MALSKRKQKRLTRFCKIVNTTLDTLSEMEDIHSEYNAELLSMMEQVRSYNQVLPPSGNKSSDLTDLSFCNTEENPATDQPSSSAADIDEPLPELNPESLKDTTPIWVKLLWKKIMMKCHPDRINLQDLSLVDIVKRQKYVLLVQSAYSSKNWTRVLYIGILVDEFTEDLTIQNQIEMLTKMSTKSNEKINSIKSSIVWQWGIEWGNLENRITIISHCCKLNGIQLLPKSDLIKILLALE